MQPVKVMNTQQNKSRKLLIDYLDEHMQDQNFKLGHILGKALCNTGFYFISVGQSWYSQRRYGQWWM